MAHGTYTGTYYASIDLRPAYRSVTIGAAATISVASGSGIVGGTAGAYTVHNDGMITAAAYGIDLQGGGLIDNAGGASIIGAIAGIKIEAAGTVNNRGDIAATADHGRGIEAYSGGTITNYATIQSSGAYAEAVYMEGGGFVTNAPDGTISSTGKQSDAVALGSGATLRNSGLIESAGDGIKLFGTGFVTNEAGAQITAGLDAIVADGAARVTNGGRITSAGSNSVAVGIGAGGTIINSGSIYADGYGSQALYISGAGYVDNRGGGGIIADAAEASGIVVAGLATIVNDGTVEATALSGDGITVGDGLVETGSGSFITAGIGVRFTTATSHGTLLNDGTIEGGRYGVSWTGGGSIVNAGLIEGNIGIDVSSGSGVTITDSGTIGSTALIAANAVYFGNGDNVLQLAATGALIGAVKDATNSNTLELLAGGTKGELSGIGTQFIDLKEFLVDPNANWHLYGANSIGATTTLDVLGTLTVNSGTLLDDNGLVEVSGSGILLLDSALEGGGTVAVSGGGTAEFAAGAGSETVRFGSGGGTVKLDDPLAAGLLTIDGLGTLAAIDLTNVTYSHTQDRIITGSGSVTVEQNGTIVAELIIGGSNTLALLSDGTGGTDIVSISTYSGNYYSPVMLDDRYVTISAGAYVHVAQTGGAAIYGGGNQTRILMNEGDVEATGGGIIGVDLAGGGTLVNAETGMVNATGTGIWLGGTSGTVQNAGMIAGADYAVDISETGYVVNTGTISVSGDSGVGIMLGMGAANPDDRTFGRAVVFSGTVLNEATISATGSDAAGIEIGGGSVTNASGALIDAPLGVRVVGDVGSVINYGSITSGIAAIYLSNGGSIYNENDGIISSPQGVRVVGDVGSVTNRGHIYGSSIGVLLGAGGSVLNEFDGIISSPDGVRVVGDVGSVTNYGQIGDGTGIGVYLGAGGTISNDEGGTISGTIGVEIGPGAAGTLSNAGTIEGSLYSVRFDSASDVLVIGYTESEITFDGLIEGGGGTLLMIDSFHAISGLGGTATLSGPVSGTFSGFGAYIVDSGGGMVLTGSNTIGPAQSLTNDGVIDLNGTLIVDNSLAGTGRIELYAGATLGLAGGSAVYIDFGGPSVLELADPAGVTSELLNFAAGDVIDLTGVAYSSADTVTYSAGRITVSEGATTVAAFTLGTAERAGTVFTLESDGKQGTDVVIERSIGNPYLHTDPLGAGQIALLNEALQALSTYVSAVDHIARPGLNFFMPPSLTEAAGIDSAVAGDVNIANGYPIATYETIQLGAKIQGAVLTGPPAVTLLGHTGDELLVGNAGNDTIRAAGGSGTVMSGTGHNEIYTGRGDIQVSSAGDDTIYSGKSGITDVTALGSATVHAGGGFTEFTDSGTALSEDKVKGGSGAAIMNSGLGQDTFVGGSGLAFMNDTGPGHVAFQFNKGAGGTDIVTGFDPGNGDYIRTTPNSNGWGDFEGHIQVIDGNSFVVLADGTNLEFVGFTNLSSADFHG